MGSISSEQAACAQPPEFMGSKSSEQVFCTQPPESTGSKSASQAACSQTPYNTKIVLLLIYDRIDSYQFSLLINGVT